MKMLRTLWDASYVTVLTMWVYLDATVHLVWDVFSAVVNLLWELGFQIGYRLMRAVLSVLWPS